MQALDLSSSSEAKVLTPLEKGRSTARQIWKELGPKAGEEVDWDVLKQALSEQISDPDERLFAMLGLSELSKARVEDFLAATEFDSSEVLARMNQELDARHGEAEPVVKEARESSKRLISSGEDVIEDDVA